MSTEPASKPPRRWFQFRLSTLLALIAIAAWAMSLEPFAHHQYECYQGMDGKQNWVHTIDIGLERTIEKAPTDLQWPHECDSVNPGYVYPAIALAGLIAWRGFELFRNRRREATNDLRARPSAN